MSFAEFGILYAILMATMVLSRCVPLFALRGRELSARVVAVLDLIPVAAFSALVANDLFQPATWASGSVWQALVPLIAAGGVVAIAKRTGSLIMCAVAGLVFYLVLGAIPL